jgi:hypothetical protein
MSARLLNRAKMATATTGTGTVTLGAASTGCATFAEAGAVNATVYTYVIEDGNDFEIGTGTYTSAGTTFSRDTVILSKISGTAGTSKINLSGSATIAITAAAEDFRIAAITSGSVAGITDLAVADGGTGASTAAGAATNLGLGTGDSPQFTAINLGHATDTTLTRTGAGDIAVEGNAVYRAGGTDVAIADGGTGASTAAAAFTALKQAASETDTGVVELATTAEALTGTDTARAVTPAGLAAATVMQGRHTIWIPAGSMTARTTNGAASGTTELATNDVMLRTLDFDATTSEGAQFMLAMPKSWDESTVTFVPHWTAASGSGTCIWTLAGVAFTDDDAMDTAFGTSQSSSDTLLTANDNHKGPESSAITIAGTPAAEDLVAFQVTRDISDTLAVDAKLIGIKLFVTLNAATDT